MTEEFKELLNSLSGNKETEKTKEPQFDSPNGNSDLFIPLFLTLLAFSNSPNAQLEKELSFMEGKVDTLEKMVIGGNK